MRCPCAILLQEPSVSEWVRALGYAGWGTSNPRKSHSAQKRYTRFTSRTQLTEKNAHQHYHSGHRLSALVHSHPQPHPGTGYCQQRTAHTLRSMSTTQSRIGRQVTFRHSISSSSLVYTSCTPWISYYLLLKSLGRYRIRANGGQNVRVSKFDQNGLDAPY